MKIPQMKNRMNTSVKILASNSWIIWKLFLRNIGIFKTHAILFSLSIVLTLVTIMKTRPQFSKWSSLHGNYLDINEQ